MIQRAIRAGMLDKSVYRQLTFDSTATADAVAVVAVIGVVIFVASAFRAGLSVSGWLVGILQSAIFACVSWLMLAGATWLLGTRLFHGTGSMETVMRLHGFAHVPLLLNVVPSDIVGLVALGWFLVALLYATRVALEQDTRRAGASLLLGFALVTLISLVFSLPFIALGRISSLF